MFKYLFIILLSAAASTCNQTSSSENENESQNLVEKSMKTQDPILLHDIWALREIDGQEIDTSSFPAGLPTLEIFIEEKRIGGYSGCNNYFASIDTLTENQISFGPIAATKKFCIGVKEKTYLAHLDKSTHFKIEKLHLFLYENDSLLLTFRKVD